MSSRILMRSVMSQLDNPSTVEILVNNLIGDNIGNMIFASSVQRNLMSEDTIIDTTRTNKKFSRAEIDYINENYDYFVIPLANAFRISFQWELRCLTELIKELRIPCVVVGVGVQTTVEDDLKHEFEFDELSRNFVKAVLEKSAILGLRGEVTAQYLKRLGFVSEKDFTVIGCPSMYLYGDQLPTIKQTELTRESKVSLNRKVGLPKKLHEFLVQCTKELPNYKFVPQNIDDLRLLYAGIPMRECVYSNIPSSYPSRLNHDVILNNKEIGFVNVKTWMDFLASCDFSYGSRIHGNIVSILAGTPCYIFVSDSRIKELAEYHNIPYMLAKDINQDTNIFDLYEKTDYTRLQTGHKERFDHFIQFLEMNQLPHIHSSDSARGEVYFDKKMSELEFPEPILPFSVIPLEEQMKRLAEYYDAMNHRYDDLNHKFQREKKKVKKLENLNEIQLAKRLVKRGLQRISY